MVWVNVGYICYKSLMYLKTYNLQFFKCQYQYQNSLNCYPYILHHFFGENFMFYYNISIEWSSSLFWQINLFEFSTNTVQYNSF